MLSGLGLQTLALLMAASVALDWLLGEARHWHPLVGFGNLAGAIEKRLNRGRFRFTKGMLAWLLAVLPWVAIAAWSIGEANAISSAVLHIALLYFCIGLRSLRDHMLPIGQALANGDLPRARVLTSYIVSRNTRNANESDLAKAAVESTLENGNDAVFGTLFWFMVAGGPGALLFRLANTLDAMWGYRNERFLAFGKTAARIDDVLNWIPARLTAMSYALLGNTRRAWHCWRTQASAWSSPNAGPVMSAGAGSLSLALGGPAEYEGVIEQRPPLGAGSAACAADIGRAWRLVLRTTLLWIALMAACAMVLKG